MYMTLENKDLFKYHRHSNLSARSGITYRCHTFGPIKPPPTTHPPTPPHEDAFTRLRFAVIIQSYFLDSRRPSPIPYPTSDSGHPLPQIRCRYHLPLTLIQTYPTYIHTHTYTHKHNIQINTLHMRHREGVRAPLASV
jgi:hypothetical protein